MCIKIDILVRAMRWETYKKQCKKTANKNTRKVKKKTKKILTENQNTAHFYYNSLERFAMLSNRECL